jgi:MFS family permease
MLHVFAHPRTVQVFATVIYCLFAAGIVFGYAALKPVLKQEGAYQDVCGADSGASPDDVDTCVEIRLNLMFTVAAVSTNVAALPVGTVLDHLGPRVCGLSGALFLTTGSLLMAFEESLPFDGLLVGYLFLALGGPFTYISSFQLSNAFPKHSGLILALLTGAFDASSALFLGYRVIFEKTGGSFGHDRFFLAYLVVPLIIAVLQFVLLPKHSYKTIGEMIEQVDQPLPEVVEDQMDENTALLAQERIEHRDAMAADLEDLLGSTRADKQQEREEKKNDVSGVWGVMHSYSSWQQIRSPWFILICSFTGMSSTQI